MSGPDLQRLDAMSRSPIQANVAEGEWDQEAWIRATRLGLADSSFVFLRSGRGCDNQSVQEGGPFFEALS